MPPGLAAPIEALRSGQLVEVLESECRCASVASRSVRSAGSSPARAQRAVEQRHRNRQVQLPRLPHAITFTSSPVSKARLKPGRSGIARLEDEMLGFSERRVADGRRCVVGGADASRR